MGEVRAGLSDTCKWKWDPTWKTNAPESGGGEERETGGEEEKRLFKQQRAPRFPRCLPPRLLQVRPNQKQESRSARGGGETEPGAEEG